MIAFVMALALCGSCAVPVFAYDSTYNTSYSFGSGPDSRTTFGKPTGYDEPAKGDPLATNERRDKNAAFTPPPYGIFSGNIPTDPSNPYIESNTPNPWSGNVVIMDGYAAAGPSGVTSAHPGAPDNTSSLTVNYIDTPGLLPSTSMTASLITEPAYYPDGSIGTLFIEKLNKTMKVFQGESLENMRKGIGHFVSTSAWDSNVGLAGHNRGAAAYFSFVKNLDIGDKLTYTTPYGTRSYVVTSKDIVSETDLSSLEWTADNCLTLITCLEDTPQSRISVRCVEIR